MRFLVAGGSGFVGSHVCRRLLDEGHEVTCVDNLITGRLNNIADLIVRPGFVFVQADVTTLGRGSLSSKPADIVLHLASPASPVDYDRHQLDTLAANSTGTWRLLEIAAAMDARFVYVSTSEVYGDPLVHPQSETYWGNVDPIGPRACYDEGKRFGEALVTSWRRERGGRTAIVRVFNTYGPALRLDDGRVVPEFLAAALAGRPLPIQGHGSQTRSYMYVSDLVEGLLCVATDPDLDGQVLNIGNPHEVTVRELADRILAITGSSAGATLVPGRSGDPRRRCPDISRMIARYGWRPTVALDEGLRRTVEWLQESGVLARQGGEV
ncbi:MAG: NAD-dependent epimerase/dehydratase family protein [Isosphaeraceae bacterium]|nr:NAD-dependent epimerase/dehydratase family protein [Isosphaeraceae bacterium]